MRVSALVTLAAATLCYVVPSPASAMGTAFYHLADSNDEALKYELARSLAIELLGNARGLATATESLATEAARNLASARFVVAADAEADRQCAQVAASLFVLQTVPNTIYVCADTRRHVLFFVGLASAFHLPCDRPSSRSTIETPGIRYGPDMSKKQRACMSARP